MHLQQVEKGIGPLSKCGLQNSYCYTCLFLSLHNHKAKSTGYGFSDCSLPWKGSLLPFKHRQQSPHKRQHIDWYSMKIHINFSRKCTNNCDAGIKCLHPLLTDLVGHLGGLGLKENRLRKKSMLLILIIPLPTMPWTGTIKVYHLINFPLSLTCKANFNSHCVLSCWLQTVRKQRKCRQRHDALHMVQPLCSSNFMFAQSHPQVAVHA